MRSQFFRSFALLLFFAQQLLAVDYSELSQKVIDLRQEVDQLHKEQDQEAQARQLVLNSLISRKTELNDLLMKERMRRLQLLAKKSNLLIEKQPQKLSRSDQKMIEDWIFQLENWVLHSIPYHRDERLNSIEEFKNAIRDPLVPVGALVQLMWQFTEKEIQRGHDNEYEVTLIEEISPSGPVQVEAVRLGWVHMMIKTTDGRWGYFVKKENQWKLTWADKDHEKESFKKLFKKFRSKQEKGFFELPLFSKTMLRLTALSSVALAKEGLPDQLEEVFQREILFLNQEKESFQKIKKDGQSRHLNQLKALESQLSELEKELAQKTSSNEILFSEVQKLEKIKREMAQEAGSLPRTYKKALKVLQDSEAALNFSVPQTQFSLAPGAENVNTNMMKVVFERAFQVLAHSAQVDVIEGTYKTQSEELESGQIRRIGLVGAQLIRKNGVGVLGPAGKKGLKLLEFIENPGDLSPVYLYENVSEAAVYKRAATWVDRLTNLSPLILVIFVFVIVFALFFVFARE